MAREELGLCSDLVSDSASILGLTKAIRDINGVKFLRDPTRAGLSGVCHDICKSTGYGVHLKEHLIPVKPQVTSMCEMLGFDPLYLACEGRLIAVVKEQSVDTVLKTWQIFEWAKDATVIGHVTDDHHDVVIETAFSSKRRIAELEHDPLPRIC